MCLLSGDVRELNYSEELNRYYCLDHKECAKANNCDKAPSEEIIEIAKSRRIYLHLTAIRRDCYEPYKSK